MDTQRSNGRERRSSRTVEKMTPRPPALRLEVLPELLHHPPSPAITTSVVLRLTATDAPVESVRPRLVTALALDVSGSMAGAPLAQLQASVVRIVELLQPDDELAVVAFSAGAHVVSPCAPIGAARSEVVRAVKRLVADGGTHLEAGLRVAHGALSPATDGARRSVLLLSDGAPNQGASTPDELRAVVWGLRQAVSFSCLGYGADHHGEALEAIAHAGGGRYGYVSDPAVCELELAQAVGAQGDIAVEDLEFCLSPSRDVELVRVLGGGPSRVTGEGLVVPVSELAARAVRHVVVELRARAPHAGLADLFGVRVRFRNAGEKAAHELVGRGLLRVTAGEPAADPAATEALLLALADEARARARDRAARQEWEAAAHALRDMMAKIAAAPGFGEKSASPLAEAYAQLLDEACMMERRPRADEFRAFTAVSRATSLSFGTSASSLTAGLQSQRMMVKTAGIVPQAALVVVEGPNVGTRFAIGPRACLGRTSSADIPLDDPSVSRRHAEVVAMRGVHYVNDLGSTNATRVNGVPLGFTPRALAPGDRIEAGCFTLEYRLG